MVAPGRVQHETPEKLTGFVVDHADVEVGDEQHDPSVPVGAPDANFGAGVDFSALGVCVGSTWAAGQYAFDTGTSTAAPHVAGVAALYLANHPGASPAQVKQALLDQAVHGGITGDPDVPPIPIVNAAGL